MRIEVTAEDIAAGVQRECRKCPVALAMQRVLGGPVFVTRWGIGKGGYAVPEWDKPVPDLVRDFMRDFDAGRPVAPFSFELEIQNEI